MIKVQPSIYLVRGYPTLLPTFIDKLWMFTLIFVITFLDSSTIYTAKENLTYAYRDAPTYELNAFNLMFSFSKQLDKALRFYWC